MHFCCSHSCQPNCKAESLKLGGRPRIFIFAAERAIAAGEELTYDYLLGGEPGDDEGARLEPCTCCAPNCRGMI